MLEPITPIISLYRPTYDVADPTILDPHESTCLVPGEWVTLDSNGKAVRVTALTTALAMQVWGEKGATDGQVLKKVTVLALGAYEAETDMFDGAGVYAVGTDLTVDDFTIDSITRSALKVASSGNAVHAICTKPPQLNGGKLRFRRLETMRIKA